MKRVDRRPLTAALEPPLARGGARRAGAAIREGGRLVEARWRARTASVHCSRHSACARAICGHARYLTGCDDAHLYLHVPTSLVRPALPAPPAMPAPTVDDGSILVAPFLIDHIEFAAAADAP